MSLFKHELKSYQKSTLVWVLSLGALTFLYLVAMYPSFTSDVDASRKILSQLPAAVRDGFGINLESFFTILGFYSYLLTFILLAGAIQAMNLGVGLLSKEESGKTADFLLTKPISRAKILTTKLTTGVCVLLFTNVCFVLISFGSAMIASDTSFDKYTYLLLSSTLLLVQLAFLSIGLLVSVLLKRVKSVVAVSLPVVFTLYIVATMGAIIGNDNVKYVTPFKFYDTTYIIKHNSLEAKFLIYELILIVVTVAISYYVFIHKDIRAAS